MASFQISPGVQIKETSLDLIITAVPINIGAIVGDFEWGPVDQITLIDSENSLSKKFGLPVDRNAKDWFCASNFLSYSKDLRVIRVIDSASAVANAIDLRDAAITDAANNALTKVIVKNREDFEYRREFLSGIKGAASKVNFIAKYPGIMGNDVGISYADAAAFATWTHADEFEYAPGANEFALVVALKGVVVERFMVSGIKGTKDDNNESNYADVVINGQSNYIYCLTENLISLDGNGDMTSLTSGNGFITLNKGASAEDTTDFQAEKILGWNIFAGAENIDINYLIQGGSNNVVGKHMVQNVAETRKDCVAFLSPSQASVVFNATPATSMVNYRKTDLNINSSYAVVDGNYKYQYDPYNEKSRWIPLNGDTAGLMARTSHEKDPWWSNAGLNRGQIKSVIKLAFNPSKAQRDELYKNGINPIVSWPGEGVCLWGDKTMLGRPSGFDRLNVRMLFIVLGKAISKSSRYLLFEFNDIFTRERFVQMVEPYLRDVQGRRGIQRLPDGKDGFYIVADERINTPQVIDANEFRAAIAIKPNRSINFIGIELISTPTGAVFEEVIYPSDYNPRG